MEDRTKPLDGQEILELKYKLDQLGFVPDEPVLEYDERCGDDLIAIVSGLIEASENEPPEELRDELGRRLGKAALFVASDLGIDKAMPDTAATLRLLKTYLPALPRKVLTMSASVQTTIDRVAALESLVRVILLALKAGGAVGDPFKRGEKLLPGQVDGLAKIIGEWNKEHPIKSNVISGTGYIDDGVGTLKHLLFALKFGDSKLFASPAWDEYCAQTLVGVVTEAKRLAEIIPAAAVAKK